MDLRTAKRLKSLERQVKQLQKRVSDLELKNQFQSKLLEIGKERYGLDLAAREWSDAIRELRKEKRDQKQRYGLVRLCAAAGYTKQGFYDACARKDAQKAQEEAILLWVKNKRKEQPFMGTEKLYHELHREKDPIYHIGRDRLYNILFYNGMLIKMKRNGRRTTNSNHSYGYAPNLIYGLEITRPNQVLVNDITYIRVGYGFAYLVLITDLYSRRIIAYDFSNSLNHAGALRALKRACRLIGDTRGVIHHSDRGVQYASHKFRKYLKSKNMLCSMTEELHVYENAVAERVNGILKNELGLSFAFPNYQMAKKAIERAIRIYNFRRPHQSLDYAYPNEVYFGKVKLNKNFQVKKWASILG